MSLMDPSRKTTVPSRRSFPSITGVSEKSPWQISEKEFPRRKGNLKTHTKSEQLMAGCIDCNRKIVPLSHSKR